MFLMIVKIHKSSSREYIMYSSKLFHRISIFMKKRKNLQSWSFFLENLVSTDVALRFISHKKFVCISNKIRFEHIFHVCTVFICLIDSGNQTSFFFHIFCPFSDGSIFISSKGIKSNTRNTHNTRTPQRNFQCWTNPILNHFSLVIWVKKIKKVVYGSVV